MKKIMMLLGLVIGGIIGVSVVGVLPVYLVGNFILWAFGSTIRLSIIQAIAIGFGAVAIRTLYKYITRKEK